MCSLKLQGALLNKGKGDDDNEDDDDEGTPSEVAWFVTVFFLLFTPFFSFSFISMLIITKCKTTS